MKRNVVFFIQNFSRAGGSERAVSLIANYLAEKQYNISILSICGNNTCYFKVNKNIQIYTLLEKNQVDNRREFLDIYFALIHFYKLHSFDVCIDVFASLSIYTNLIKRFFKMKNITWEHYNYFNNMGFNKIGRWFAIKFSDRIITLTATDRDNYLNNNKDLKAEKISYIYNPSPFQNASVNVKEKLVIAVGRLEKLKGFDQMLDIWGRLAPLYPEWKLQIIGEGEERDNLQSIIDEKALVSAELLGKRSNMEDFYQKAAILVSTSEREGLPMTMIEAQSFGVPIVSFDYETGPKDIITPGVDGIIIAQGDGRNRRMAQEMMFLFERTELLNKMGAQAYISSKRFEIKNIGCKWNMVIDGLIGER